MLWEFGSRLLSGYFGPASPPRTGSIPGYLPAADSTSYGASLINDDATAAPSPEHLLAGRLMLHTLSTPDFLSLVQVITSCTYTSILPADLSSLCAKHCDKA